MQKAATFHKKTIKDIELDGKRILLRADFNVPLDERGKISSDFRIVSTLPTIEYLLGHHAEIVILAHLGRPEGKVNEKFSLKQVAQRLQKLLKHDVGFIDDCVGDKVLSGLKGFQAGRVTVLENVRFHEAEEQNDPEFAKALVEASRPDYVVQDGFGVVHRAHASTEGISHLKPAVAGLLLEQEVTALEDAISHPQKPLVAVLGGAKIADKLPLVERFLKEADTILIGGAIANTFLKFTGNQIGKSMFDAEGEAEIKRILKQAKPGQLILPTDVGVAKEVNEHAQRSDCRIEDVHANEDILDIGPTSAELCCRYVAAAGTVIWNGTLGYAENVRFAKGSAMVARTLSEHYPSLTSIIGGGDTADFVLEWQAHNPKAHLSHISTGGGASLELLSGKKLPGVEALMNR